MAKMSASMGAKEKIEFTHILSQDKYGENVSVKFVQNRMHVLYKAKATMARMSASNGL